MPVRFAPTLSLLSLLCLFAVTSLGPNAPTVAHAEDKPEAAADDWIEGIDSLARGSYRRVRSVGKKLAKADATKAQGLYLQARAELEDGDPNKVVKLLEDAGIGSLEDVALRCEYLNALVDTGAYKEAEEHAKALSQMHQLDARVWRWLGEARWQQGKFDEAKTAFENARKLTDGKTAVPEDYQVADVFDSSAWSCYRLNDLKNANNRWYVAIDSFKNHVRSQLGIAMILLETNKDVSARENWAREVTKFNPSLGHGYLMIAKAYFYRWQSEEARRALDTAVRSNKYFVEGLAYRAAYFVSLDLYEEAEKDIKAALEVNPNSVAALGAKALLEATLGQKEAFEATCKRVFAFNHRPGEFYLIVADGLANRLRLDECVEMYKLGMEVQEDLWPLQTGIGRAYLNMGQIQEGRDVLEKAFQNDPLRNNLQTRNMLTLLDHMLGSRNPDGSFKSAAKYDTVEIAGGRVQLTLSYKEKQLMVPYYERELTKGMDELTSKYGGYAPEVPLMIEAFDTHADFEVRTVGIEGLPALGACFGKLITLDGYSARGDQFINWASTLRHELDHVYQLQLSNSQIPRWLAEGCSVYEERRARPEWERHMEEELFQTYAQDGLPKVKDFNEWFGDGSRVLFAYYLASIMVEYIVETQGSYQPVVEMIKAFAAKQTPDQVFKGTLGIDTQTFDAGFREYVGKRVSRLKLLPAVTIEHFDDLLEAAEDGEASPEDLAKLARAYMQKGMAADARLWAGAASKFGAETKELLYVRGMLAKSDPRFRPKEQAERSYQLLKQALNMGLEDYYLYMDLARMAQGRIGEFQSSGQTDQMQSAIDEMIFFLNRARVAFPTNAQPLGMLFQFYNREGDKERAMRMAEQICMLNESNIELRVMLMGHYREQGDFERVADMALQIIYVNPSLEEAHLARADAMRRMRQYEEAVFEFEMMGIAGEVTRADTEKAQARINAALEIGKTWFDAGDRDRAMAVVKEARREFPDSDQLRQLEEQISGEADLIETFPW